MNLISLLYPNDRAHCHRTAALSRHLARLCGYTEEDAAIIYQSALLHDIGKSCIPFSILYKPDGLTKEEKQIVQMHVDIGATIIGQTFLDMSTATIIAQQHHERLDGSGYLGLKGSDIHPYAKLVAVADVFDALISPRPYKSSWSIAKIYSFLYENAGTQFDEKIVSALLANLKTVLTLYQTQKPYRNADLDALILNLQLAG